MIALLWNALAAARNALYDRGIITPVRLQAPVVSVGSLGWGGGGKTSLVMALARLLKDAGWRVAVIAHGYRRARRDIILCLPGAAEAGVESLGDEGYLIWRNAGVAVAAARRKWQAGRAIEAAGGRFDAILVDDGFQHRRLHRDLDIVCLRAGGQKPGFLREGPRSLARAQVIVHRGTGSAPAPRMWRENGRIHLERRDRLTAVANRAGKALAPSRPCHAVCGLGDPESFVRALEAAGYTVGERIFLRDHAAFPSPLLEGIRRDPEIPWVTTEKDAIKIPAPLFPDNLSVAGAETEIPDLKEWWTFNRF